LVFVIPFFKLGIRERPLERDLESGVAHHGFIDVENNSRRKVLSIFLSGLCTPGPVLDKLGKCNDKAVKKISRIIVISIPVVAVLLLAACAATPESTAAEPEGLTFIHLNDTYRVGAVEDGKLGGFGRVVTVIRDIQAEGREVHVTHGGDLLYPSLESQLWNGEQMVEALNYVDALAPVYFVAGNHECDRRTPEHLVNALRESEFDWLGDNYHFDTGDSASSMTAGPSAFLRLLHTSKTAAMIAIMCRSIRTTWVWRRKSSKNSKRRALT
jgi:hypothetical protein